jgi:predicted GNAT superfamily acetyltransferase
MLAVVPEWRNRKLGERLKQYQADRVRALGVRTMLWTYDPLVARNAHFNINRLRAFPAEYVPNMYGANTGSTLHGALPTDRFIVSWDLDRAPTLPLGVDTPAADDDALPLLNPLDSASAPGCVPSGDAATVRVQVPVDSHGLAGRSADLAAQWRFAVRNVVSPLMATGYRVARFVRARGDQLPYYVFSRDHALLPFPPT